MNQAEFVRIMTTISNADTSFDPAGWTSDNPLWGHCVVVSLLAQEEFGGELVKGSLKQRPKYAYLKSHIWNRIDDIDIDFTQEQYDDISYKDLKGEVCSRDSILDNPDAIRRYDLLKRRFIDFRKYLG